MKQFHLNPWKMLPFWLVLLSVFLLADSKKIVSVTNVREKSTKTNIALCAKLNKYIYSVDAIEAKPYIKLTPNQYFTLKIDYEGICIKSLKPGTDYTFTINKDIPLGEYKLDKEYTFTASTTSYDPSLNFKDSGYILPAKGKISIPIETVNMNEIEVSLYRINTNNLINSINDYSLVRMLNIYSLEKIADSDGYSLWTKRLKIKSAPNTTKVTALPVGEYLKDRKAGVYVLTAQEVDDDGEVVSDYDIETQWFMISDIGLYTLRSDDGLQIYTKRLSTAMPYDNIKLELISRNNEVLDSIVAKNAQALFPDKLLNGKRGLKAQAIYAYGEDGDFSVLDLTRAAHDLSDRGVEGRTNPGKYDAYIYSNRAIFRPSESVPIEILVRDSLAKAQGDLTMSLKVFDSQEVEISTKILTTDKLGYANLSIPISQSASRGRWHIKLYTGDDKPIGSFDFLVEDFVPPKIKIDIDNDIQELIPDSETIVEATVKYLNNTPLADAAIDGNIILYKAKNPFKGYESYNFGDETESFKNTLVGTFEDTTDENGTVSISLIANDIPDSTLPLAAHITISASEPGGRPVEKTLDIFMSDKSGYIGLKPNFENGAIDMDSKATFEVVYLEDANLIKEELEYTIIEESVHWGWQFGSDEWAYYRTYSDEGEVINGRVTTSSSEPTLLTLDKLDWGSYRIEVTVDNIVTTYRFGSGYEESISKSSPDRLPVAIDKQSYSVGDEVRVHITPKFTGPLMVSVANHNIIETKSIQATAGEDQEISFVVDKSWGSSSYILATSFRAQSPKLGSNRAIGLAHIKVVNPDQMINLTLDYDHKVKSSQPTKVVVYAKNAVDDQPITTQSRFTLAAVDDAVLRLTNFKVPDPQDHFFAQQKLGIEIRDIYADLIKATGARSKFNVGAGDEQMEEAKYSDSVSNRRQVVALMTKDLTFDNNGRAEVILDIPDYQGSLKLMAVAWSMDAIGSQSGDMIVKDEISPEIYLPRFISVGDSVKSLLGVDFDIGAKAGKYQIILTNENSIQRVSRDSFEFEFDGSKPSRFSTQVDIKAPSLHDEKLTVEIIKDGISLATKEWELAVRAKYPQAYIRKMGLVDTKGKLDSKRLFDTSVWSDINSIYLKVSSKALLPTQSIANELIEYGGRCAEQTTSRAMPWLFMPENLASKQTINRQVIIQNAIDRLLNYQKLDGGFGLWSSSYASVWVSSYVLDFLTRAKKVGYSVPDRNIKIGLDWIENSLDRWSSSPSKQEADAYALYVLTRSGRTLMSEMIFHAKNRDSKIRSAQAWGHLASAMAFVGEKELSIALFKKAKKSLASYLNSGSYYSNYGGGLRDEASLVVLMIESNIGLDWESGFSDLALTTQKRRYFSTQEMSLLLRASYQANIKPTKLLLSSGGKPLAVKDGEYTTRAKDIKTLPIVTNDSSAKVWYSASYKGTPVAQSYSSIDDKGFSISKKIYTMDGSLVELDKIEQNSRLVIVLEGEIESNHVQNPLVTDWVVAGFELENPNINGIDAITTLEWIDKQSPTEHVEYRDDRFVAALKIDEDMKNTFRLAYVVRAVSKGEFALPPTRIEDMYQPQFRAFSKIYTSPISIKEKSKIEKKMVDSNTSNSLPNTISDALKEGDYLAVNSKIITDLSRYSILDINFLRNSIFAHAGLNFTKTNPMLHKIFSEFSWYHPNQKSSSAIYGDLSRLQKNNIQTLLDEEKRRGGGLVLADFYRVNNKLLSANDLKKYNKEQLYILRNSLFARRGVRFKNQKLVKIFSYMIWYRPTDVTSSTVFDQMMSEQEKANVQLIISLEKR